MRLPHAPPVLKQPQPPSPSTAASTRLPSPRKAFPLACARGDKKRGGRTGSNGRLANHHYCCVCAWPYALSVIHRVRMGATREEEDDMRPPWSSAGAAIEGSGAIAFEEELSSPCVRLAI
jgi:hypothetical protein